MANTYRVTYDINNLPMGIDTADVNGAVNITKEGAPKLSFGAAKCGEGTYRDTEYLKTRAQYDALGLPFIAYYVLRYSVPVSQQVANFKKWSGSGCYAYSPDLEKTQDSANYSNSTISVWTRDFIKGLQDAGLNVVPYTTGGWINERFRNPITALLPTWCASGLRWWLAQYNYIGERNNLDIPTGILKENVIIFQTWNRMFNYFGSKYDSQYVDCDRWVGIFPTTPTQEDDIPAELTDSEKITKLWNAHPELH